MNSSLDPLLSPFFGFELKPRCRVSDPTQPHTIRLRLGPPLPPFGCFTCGTQDSYYGKCHYYCPTCDLQFHYECHEFPREVRHPYHLQHPLTFSVVESGTLISTNRNLRESYTSEPDTPREDGIYGDCDWCGEALKTEFYRCSVCSFSLDLDCCRTELPPLTIANPKSHEHLLNFMPRPLPVPCDACGSADVKDPSYVCLMCNYVVHLSCIGLPRVIKITRHPHRVSHTPYLPPGKRSCGVCYKDVDAKYGAYSCQEGCSYVLHPKCATNQNIWDEKELEWEPEEPDETEDIDPFKKIGDNEIKHFSHEHHMWLDEEQSIGKASEQCQACMLPIDKGTNYNCMQCDFFLHESCADLPRKKYHALHRHPLILDALPLQNYSSMCCSACERASSGFMYRCTEKYCHYQLDVRCASISEPFIHKSHEHPLFSRFQVFAGLSCGFCRKNSIPLYLKCINDCEFVMCFECATLPDVVRYKYDDHPLTLSCGEEATDLYWCEVCESELDPEEWFYTCDECCVTLHVSCLFDPLSVCMKIGRSFNYRDHELEVIRNDSCTRPVCYQCYERSSGAVLLKVIDDYFCSLYCFHMFLGPD